MNQNFSNLKEIKAVNGSVVLKVKPSSENKNLHDAILSVDEAMERVTAMILLASIQPKNTSKDIMEIVLELIGKSIEAIEQQTKEGEDLPKSAQQRIDRLQHVYDSAKRKAEEVKKKKQA